MNSGVVAFTFFYGILATAFFVIMAFGLFERSHYIQQSEACGLDNDCNYFERCDNDHCVPGCTGIQCPANTNCVNEFHGWRCECIPGYISTENGTCRYNTIDPVS